MISRILSVLLTLSLLSEISYSQTQNDYHELEAEYRTYLNYVYVDGGSGSAVDYRFKIYSILCDSNGALIDTIFRGRCLNFSCEPNCSTRINITPTLDGANVVCNSEYCGINAIYPFQNVITECFQKKFRHKVVIYAWSEEESGITCENVQDNKAPIVNTFFTHTYNDFGYSVNNMQHQIFYDTMTGVFNTKNIHFSMLNYYFVNSYVFTANNKNISGTNLAHSASHCLDDTTVVLAAFNWPNTYDSLHVYRRANYSNTWTEVSVSNIQAVSYPNLNIGNKEYAPYFTTMIKEQLDTITDVSYIQDHMNTRYEYSLCYKSSCGNPDSIICMRTPVIIEKPLTHIPHDVIPVCSSIKDPLGELVLKNTIRRGGYRYSYKPHGGYRNFAYVDSFSYEIHADNIYNFTFESQCSSLYKEGTISAKQNVTIDGLPPGDYKIIITPIIPYKKVGSQYQNIYDESSFLEDVNKCFETSYQFNFTVEYKPLPKPLGEDKILCSDQSVILSIPQRYVQSPSTTVWGNAYCSPAPTKVTAVNDSTRIVTNGGGGYYTVNIRTEAGCVLKDTVIVADLQPVTKNYVLPSALMTNASKYNAGWPTHYSSIKWNNRGELDNFMSSNIYYSGKFGIYRPSEIHDYSDTLNSTTSLVSSYGYTSPSAGLNELLIKNSGNIINYKYFNYGNPLFSDCVPSWVLNNKMTKYSPSGFDIEARDILDMYSSALYGYKDQLPIVVSTNAEMREIGFESFEEYSNSSEASNYYNNMTQLNNSAGNIDIVRKTESGIFKKSREYEIVRAFNRYAMIKGNICSACDETFECNIFAQSVPYDFASEKIKEVATKSINTRIMSSPCGDEKFSILQLDENIPSDESAFRCKFWTGTVSVESDFVVPAIGEYNVELDNEKYHTGKYSLKLPSDQRVIIPQFDLELKPQKTYHISAWFHKPAMLTESPETLRYTNQADSIGVLVILPNNEKVFFTPKGEVVEGWQRLEGTFTMPQGMRTEIKLGFVGKSTYNVDDIRIFPQNSAIQTYVYNPQNYKVNAVLDANNYATVYQYDDEGNLFAIKKETIKGIKTIQVSSSHLKTSRP